VINTITNHSKELSTSKIQSAMVTSSSSTIGLVPFLDLDFSRNQLSSFVF
jgi:hypothetical protein